MQSPFAPNPVKQSFLVSLSAYLSLVYALVVRELRTEHRNAALGILLTRSAAI